MTIDLIFLAVFVYAFYVGFNRGVIKTIFAVLSVVIGFVAAIHLTPKINEVLAVASGTNNAFLPFIAFLATLIGVMMAVRLGANAFEEAIKAADLAMIDKFIGGILFCGIGILIFSGVLIFFEKARLLSQPAMDDSAFFPYLKAFPDQVKMFVGRFSPMVADMWDRMIDMFEKLGEKQAQS